MNVSTPEINNASIAGSNNVYPEPPKEHSSYDDDPGHLQTSPWQSYLDERYGVLTRSFTQARSAAETARATVGQLFDTKKYESRAALLSMPASLPTKTASLAERVRQLAGRM